MSQIAESAKYSVERGEHIERVVEIYESVDASGGQNVKTDMEGTNMKTQQTGGHTAWSRCYILTVVCLLVLCVLLLTVIIVMWIKFNNLDNENNQLQTSNNNLTSERDQLQTRYNNLTLERDQLQTRYNNLTTERGQLLRERDEYLKTLNMCKFRCVTFSSSFYYMSTKTKTWDDSRKDCKDKGADLVIINSKEEQEFISKQMSSSNYWIGLSDRDEHGKWKWVDNTPLTTGSWANKELNNKYDEDCAEIYRSSNSIVWNDKKCSDTQRWICEKRVS